MSRLHDMKVGKLSIPEKKQFKVQHNDKESIFQRLKTFLRGKSA